VRDDSIASWTPGRPGWHPQRYLIHPRLVPWRELALLTVAVTVATCLLGECDQSSKNRARQTLVGSGGMVRSIAFRPDGMMLSSVVADGSIVLWDLAANQEYPFHAEEFRHARCAAFSPDSKILAIASMTGAVALHNLVTQESRILEDSRTTTASARSLAFAPNGAILAVGQQDGQITLWDIGTGRSQRALSGHTGFIVSLVFSPDGATLASSSTDHSVRLWDLPAGREQLVLDSQPNTATILAFSHDGQLLVLGDKAKPVISLREATTGRERAVLAGLKSNPMAVAISPDGSTLVVADFRGLVIFWELPTLKISPKLLRHTGVHSLAFAPNGHTLATGGFDGTIHLWDWPYSAMTDAPQPVASSVWLINIAQWFVNHRKQARAPTPRYIAGMQIR
jgi:WD40 repeat protein